MAKDETKRLSPKDLSKDVDNLQTLKNLKDYSPNNRNFTLEKVEAAYAKMREDHGAEKTANDAAKEARDIATASEWAYHNAMLGVKSQVESQYGDDSNELQNFGLIKKSERKSPGPRKSGK